MPASSFHEIPLASRWRQLASYILHAFSQVNLTGHKVYGIRDASFILSTASFSPHNFERHHLSVQLARSAPLRE